MAPGQQYQQACASHRHAAGWHPTSLRPHQLYLIAACNGRETKTPEIFVVPPGTITDANATNGDTT